MKHQLDAFLFFINVFSHVKQYSIVCVCVCLIQSASTQIYFTHINRMERSLVAGRAKEMMNGMIWCLFWMDLWIFGCHHTVASLCHFGSNVLCSYRVTIEKVKFDFVHKFLWPVSRSNCVWIIYLLHTIINRKWHMQCACTVVQFRRTSARLFLPQSSAIVHGNQQKI